MSLFDALHRLAARSTGLITLTDPGPPPSLGPGADGLHGLTEQLHPFQARKVHRNPIRNGGCNEGNTRVMKCVRYLYKYVYRIDCRGRWIQVREKDLGVRDLLALVRAAVDRVRPPSQASASSRRSVPLGTAAERGRLPRNRHQGTARTPVSPAC